MKGRLILLVLFSSLLLALALPNEVFVTGNPLLGAFCLAPLFMALELAPSFRFASLLGVIFGAVSTVLANYWLLFFREFAVWTLGGTVLGYIGYNALLAPFLYGLLRLPPCLLPRSLKPLVLAMAWSLYEYLKSVGFLGYPWGLIAYPVHMILPLIQFVDLTGIWGLSFLMALINAVAAEGLLGLSGSRLPSSRALPGWKGTAVFTAALTLACLGYGAFRLTTGIPSEKSAELLLVQQNTDPWSSGGVLESVKVNQMLTRQGLKQAPGKPDLVVWSENSLGYALIGNERFFSQNPKGDPLLPFFAEAGTYFLLGAPLVLNREQAMNATLLLSPGLEVLDTYGKQHPVPFAESVPFWEVDWVRRLFDEVIGLEAMWTMGSRNTVFRLPLRKGGCLSFSTPICFEDAFADLCRRFILEGAELWINLTNDSWSKTVSAEVQHYVAARFRAVENRRVLIRSTNGGVTVVVGPKGEEIARLPLFAPNHLYVRIPVYGEARFTPYTLYGDYLPLCFAGLLLILLLGQFFRRPAGPPLYLKRS